MGENKTNEEINDANESLKLLRLKIGSKGTNGVLNTNGNNDNYRKPFNPNLGELDKNLININSNKNTFDINSLNIKKTENNFGNITTKNNINSNNNLGRVRKGPIEEIKDDRPAFNEKGENIYE
jgi:hypothetical protein